MDTARQRALGGRELQVQPETTAIPVLISEADHQHPQGKWNSVDPSRGLASFPARLLQPKKKPIILFIQVVIICGEESFILWRFSGVIES